MPSKETFKSNSMISVKSMAARMAANSQQNPVKILEDQHREVEHIFAEIEKAGDKAFQVKKQLLEELSGKIMMHTELEEEIFYLASEKVDADLTQEAIEEHANIKGMLAKLEDLDVEDETFDAKLKVLEELVSHHVEGEEKELFPKCEKVLGREKMLALGREMEKKMNREGTQLRKNSKDSDGATRSRAH